MNWEELPPQGVNVRDLAVFDGRFVGISLGRIVVSNDLVTWETLPFPEIVSRVIANEESLVAMGRGGVIYATPDLEAWETYTSTLITMLTDVIFHEGRFFALGFAFGDGLGVAVKIPVVGRLKEAGRRTVDRSNIRQIGQASLIYAEENRGIFPPRGGSSQLGLNSRGELDRGMYTPSLHSIAAALSRVSGLNDARVWISRGDPHSYVYFSGQPLC